jgi:S-adenosylmethionine hydrolase
MSIIVMMTDFGVDDPYQAQMQAVLIQQAPGMPVISLFSTLPDWDVQLSAYLIPAYIDEFPSGTVFLCVVDPGVGTSQRQPVALEADGQWLVGPDNGLFNVIRQRASRCKKYLLDSGSNKQVSTSFHGRDIFAPAAAALARGEPVPGTEVQKTDKAMHTGWPDELLKVIYCDHYGNAITGLRAQAVNSGSRLEVAGQLISHAEVFAEVKVGEAFWYVNSNGLVEFAINQGRFSTVYNISPGQTFSLVNV